MAAFATHGDARAAIEALQAQAAAYRLVTASTTAAAGELVVVNATAGAVTVTLPTATAGAQVTVKKIDASANVVTVDPPGAATVDGDLTATFGAQWSGATLVCTGTDWLVLSSAYGGSAGIPPVVVVDNGLVAENGDTLTTEAGDTLAWETI